MYFWLRISYCFGDLPGIRPVANNRNVRDLIYFAYKTKLQNPPPYSMSTAKRANKHESSWIPPETAVLVSPAFFHRRHFRSSLRPDGGFGSQRKLRNRAGRQQHDHPRRGHQCRQIERDDFTGLDFRQWLQLCRPQPADHPISTSHREFIGVICTAEI